MPTSARRKDEVIQIRASAEAKAILNRAAALRGQKLSEFMLESARRQAEETILDQRTFFLDDDAHARCGLQKGMARRVPVKRYACSTLGADDS